MPSVVDESDFEPGNRAEVELSDSMALLTLQEVLSTFSFTGKLTHWLSFLGMGMHT